MSSTERAPEPTMEEILASIRRIISDDEASSAQQRATSAEYAEQVRADDTDEGAADTQMIDDIARVLSGGANPASNDDDIEDILDLTEPGGSAADEVMMADEPITILEEVVLENEEYAEEPRKLDFTAAFPPPKEEPPEPSFSFAGPTFVEPAASYEEDEAAPSYEEETASSYELDAAPTYETPPAPSVEMPVPEPVTAAEPLPSLDDPTTALERAIAALKAGDLAAFAREAQSEYVAPEPLYTPPQPVAEAVAAESSFAAEPASFEPEPVVAIEEEIIAEPEPEPEFQPEPEPVVPSWAAESSSWSRAEPTEPEPGPEPEFGPEPEPELEPEPLPWRSEDQYWRGAAPANEFELNPARVNGNS